MPLDSDTHQNGTPIPPERMQGSGRTLSATVTDGSGEGTVVPFQAGP